MKTEAKRHVSKIDRKLKKLGYGSYADKDPLSRLISYRTRCKHCLGLPQYYTRRGSKSYYVGLPNISADWVPSSWNKVLKTYEMNICSLAIKGYTSFYFKKYKNSVKLYLLHITCQCGQSIWIFNSLNGSHQMMLQMTNSMRFNGSYRYLSQGYSEYTDRYRVRYRVR
jgi:hypothetical protein